MIFEHIMSIVKSFDIFHQFAQPSLRNKLHQTKWDKFDKISLLETHVAKFVWASVKFNHVWYTKTSVSKKIGEF